VRVIDRPAAICGDFVSMNTIIGHDLSQLPEHQHFLQTHATNPLLTQDTLEKAIQAYFDALEAGYDSLFSVTRWQTRLYWADGRAINHNPAELLRTQDLPPVFEENSNFYLFSRASFLAAGDQRIGRNPRLFPVNRLEAFDIDEPEDFLLAEMYYRLHSSDKHAAS
jgi:CMP-N-acetylneuraminic acid synthetase